MIRRQNELKSGWASCEEIYLYMSVKENQVQNVCLCLHFNRERGKECM